MTHATAVHAVVCQIVNFTIMDSVGKWLLFTCTCIIQVMIVAAVFTVEFITAIVISKNTFC
jgi:hypothetical protein